MILLWVPVYIHYFSREGQIIVGRHLNIQNVLVFKEGLHGRTSPILGKNNLSQVVLSFVLATQHQIIKVIAVHCVTSSLADHQSSIGDGFWVCYVEFQLMNPWKSIKYKQFRLILWVDVDVFNGNVHFREELLVEHLNQCYSSGALLDFIQAHP